MKLAAIVLVWTDGKILASLPKERDRVLLTRKISISLGMDEPKKIGGPAEKDDASNGFQ